MQKPWGFHPAHGETESLRRRQTAKEVGPTWDVQQKRVKEAAASTPSVSFIHPHPSPLSQKSSWKMWFQSSPKWNASFTKLPRLPCPCLAPLQAAGQCRQPTANGVTRSKSVTDLRAKMGSQPGALEFWHCMRNLFIEANQFSFSKSVETKSLCHLKEFCPVSRSKT